MDNNENNKAKTPATTSKDGGNGEGEERPNKPGANNNSAGPENYGGTRHQSCQGRQAEKRSSLTSYNRGHSRPPMEPKLSGDF
jgi:hypothetical protein